MKFKAFLKKLSIVIAIICVVVTSTFCVYADEETFPYVEETQEVEYTDPVQEETDEPTEPETEEATEETTEETQETTEETTEESTEPTAETTEETTQQTEDNNYEVQETTQRKTLPTMAKEETETQKVNDGDLTYGYVSWTCVVAGVLVLVIVLISTRRK